jgi:hypothetical protein
VLNIPIIQGRNFSNADPSSKQSFAILSRLLASRLFPGSIPIGQRIQVGAAPDGPWYTIVGVVENVRNEGLNKPGNPALALTRVLRSLLFQMGPHDPVSFVAVMLLLILIALAATLVPARTAIRIEPAICLRGE